MAGKVVGLGFEIIFKLESYFFMTVGIVVCWIFSANCNHYVWELISVKIQNLSKIVECRASAVIDFGYSSDTKTFRLLCVQTILSYLLIVSVAFDSCFLKDCIEIQPMLDCRM